MLRESSQPKTAATLRVTSVSLTSDGIFYLILFLVNAVEKTRPEWQEYDIGQVDTSDDEHGVP